MLDGLTDANYSRDCTPALMQVNLRLERLRLLFRFSLDLHLLDPRRYEFAARAIDEIGRLVGGWIKASRAAPA
ncbi:MAG TPA: hypothetical protein PLC86_09565 [Candidatus Accumulibacter phosphatis]|nr:hypothetical protein [Candidatus Accumulibacter phosphatis]